MTEPITVTPEAQIITAQKNIASLLNVLHKADGTGPDAQPPAVSVNHVLWPQYAINAHTGELHEKPMRDASTGRATVPDSMEAARINFASARERAFFIHVLKALLPKIVLPIELDWINSDSPASLLIPEHILELLPNKEELTPQELQELTEIAQDFSSPLNNTSVLPTGLQPLLPVLHELRCSVTTSPGLPHGATSGASVVAEVEFDPLKLLGGQKAPQLTIQSFVGTDGKNYTFVALDSGKPLKEWYDAHALELALGSYQLQDMHKLINTGVIPPSMIEHLRKQFPENQFAQATTECLTGTPDEITFQLGSLISVVREEFRSSLTKNFDISYPKDDNLCISFFLSHGLNFLDNYKLLKLTQTLINTIDPALSEEVRRADIASLKDPDALPAQIETARKKSIDFIKDTITYYLIDKKQHKKAPQYLANHLKEKLNEKAKRLRTLLQPFVVDAQTHCLKALINQEETLRLLQNSPHRPPQGKRISVHIAVSQ